MNRRSFAIITVLLGLLVGWLGNVLFYGKLIGLSVPMFTIITLAALWIGGELFHLRWRWRNLWPVIPLVFFAAMVAVRADGTIVALDLLAMLSLGGLLLHYLPLEHPLDKDVFAQHVGAVVASGFAVSLSPIAEISDSAAWLKQHRLDDHARVLAVGRGLLFAVPVVVIFGLLLGSADPVFGSLVNQVLSVFKFQNADDIISQAIMTAALGWLACGALAYGVGRRSISQVPAPPVPASAQPAADSSPAAEGENAVKPRKRLLSMGIIEALMVLGSVDLLFAAFVVIQFAYFFGGQRNISVEGLTYSDYARRGFFELVAVSVLTLVLALESRTLRYGKRQENLFRALAVVMVGLTGVILASASQRMWLYEQAYGFTQLRVYTHVSMGWLAVMFGFFLLALFRVRERIFSLGVLLVLIGYLGTLNLLNVDAYMAEQNIARYHDGRDLDTCFLQSLSVDAVPAMITLYEESAAGDGLTHVSAGWWLSTQLRELDLSRQGQGSTLFSYDASRANAWTALDSIRSELALSTALAPCGVGGSLSGF